MNNFRNTISAAANAANRPLTGALNVVRNTGSGMGSIFSSMWAVILLVLIVFVALVVYYKTIGYSLELGWNRIYEMIGGRESVEVEVGGDNGVSGVLKPMTDKPSGMPGAKEGDGVLAALGDMAPTRKEVFNVSRNIYKYTDAPAVCAALGAELATYDQVKESYEAGGDWCNYGWTRGQMALYPTQQGTYDKLQQGSPEYRDACGKPGVNGGYFDNPELAFGVNCYGVKPSKGAMDELLSSQVALPPTPAEIEFEKKVQKYRDQMDTMMVLPFQKGQWSQ
jgi:hypothetical protein